MKAHRSAELAHERAATTHYHAGDFWEERGNPQHATVERGLAEADRQGAVVERQRYTEKERDL